MLRIKNGYAGLSPIVISFRATEVVTGLTGNPDFPTLAAEAVQLNDLVKDYNTALEEASAGSKVARERRDATEILLINLLHKLSFMVLGISPSDKAKILSSGFKLEDGKQPSPALTKPVPPKLKSGANSGEIICKAANQKGVKQVFHQITEYPLTETSTWASHNSTLEYTFTNCTPGKQYLVRINMSGVRKQYVTGDYVAFICQ